MKMIFRMLYVCCLLANFLFLATANVELVRRILKRQADDICGNGELLARQRAMSFTSPGFPIIYANNLECHWRLRTAPGNQIVLSFVSMGVEYERNCQFDYVIIYDGPDHTSPQTGRYCGQDPPADFTSTGHYVFVKFKSDGSETGTGFEIEFRALGTHGSEDTQGGVGEGPGVDLGGGGGGGSLGGAEGDMGGGGGGVNGGGVGDRDGVVGDGGGGGGGGGVVGDGDGGGGSGNGGGVGDRGAVVGGGGGNGGGVDDHGVGGAGGGGCAGAGGGGGFSGDGDAFIGDNCGGEVAVQDGNNENVDPTDDSAMRAGGARQQTVEVDGCNQVWHNADHGDITSPGYPSLYPSNAECTIVINAPPNQQIELTFHSFDLEEFYCVFDYVIIRDSTENDVEPLVRLCGANLPDDVQSTTGILVISFYSDAADERRGFRASFVAQAVVTTTPEPVVPLEFVIRPTDMTDLQLEDPVKQQCTVNLEEATISWFKETRELPAGESNGVFVVPEVPIGSTLIIPRFETEHQGIYSCRARVPGQLLLQAPIELRLEGEVSELSPDYISSVVSSEGSIDFEIKPEDATITDGINHVLTCSSSGSHHIIWQKDDVTIDYNDRIYLIFNNNLLIGDARIADSGIYSCVAYTEDDIKLGSASAQLTVESSLDMSDVCGLVTAREAANSTKPKDSLRIAHGEIALKGSSPWMARLWNLNTARHFCGGSLINYRWVVTAAHCIKDETHHYMAEQIEVRLGDHDSLHIEDSEIKFRVARIVLPEEYRRDSFDNDIALLELDPRVPEFTEYISPICLPKQRLSERSLVPGKNARIVGWGHIIYGGAFPRYLREVYVPIVSRATCRDSAGSKLTGNMFCAGYRQAAQGDACQGDSGGPLAMKKGEKWHLLGIISWGEGCSEAEKYGFYTKVINYVAWMRDVMTEGL